MKNITLKTVAVSIGCLFGAALASNAATLAEYRFDDVSGQNFLDSSGNNRFVAMGNPPTVSNDFPFASQYPGLIGIDRSGSSPDYGLIQNMGNPFGSSTAFTVQGWLSPSVAANADILALYGGDARIQIGTYDSGDIYGYFINSDGAIKGVTDYSGIPLNTWTHMALTYDGADLRFYVNAVLIGTESIAPGSLSGINAGFINNAYSGNYDDYGIYNTALSANQLGFYAPFTPVPESGAISLLSLSLIVLLSFRRWKLRKSARLEGAIA